MSIHWTKIKNSISDISDKFVVAVSGGVDSMFLLDFIKKGFSSDKFIVAHFNHKIRQDSDDDQNLVMRVCKNNNIPFVCSNGIGLKGIKNLEFNAREQRWKFLETVAKTYGCNMVVTAHHLNDYIENYLIGTIRGIDIISCVMPQKHENNGIVRFKPFLKDLSKKQIIDISTKRNLDWNEDSSNDDNTILRNMVRNVIIPEMEKSHNVLVTIPNVIKTLEDRIN